MRQETIKADESRMGRVFTSESAHRSGPNRNGDEMSVVVYVVLTVAMFAVLGLVQKLVERL